MKKQIESLVAKCEAAAYRARELADSENEKIAERYSRVAEELQTALDALSSALAECGS